MSARLDQLCINTIRTLAMDGIQKAKSGHPGMPMGMADVAYVLWTRFLKHAPADPDWPNRDRFVLSAGHGSMLLYGLLHLTGYDLSLETGIGVSVPTCVSAESRFETGLLRWVPCPKHEIRFLVASG